MYLHNLALRFRWFQLPTGMLIMLLQRTPVLRVVVQLEGMLSNNATAIMRSAFAVAAMGAYNSVAGATVFNVTATPTPSSPTSGAAKATFTVSEASGTATTLGISVSGAPGNPKSYSVSGTIPVGLSLVNGVGTYVNVSAPYKMTISGTPTTAGTYPLTITAWDGSNGSGGNSAKITVNFTITGGTTNVAPSITTQPANQTVTAGGAASFTVAASGTPAPTYQWQKGGANIAGATSAAYSIASTVAGDAGNYTAVATNSAGTATSAVAMLTVSAATTAPVITTQPASQTVAPGGVASFTVAASGNPAPTYQWQKGGVAIAGATSATYSLASVAAGDADNYTAVATNSVGTATSAVATLTVSAATTAPAITTQPASQTVAPGGAASFTVAASGNPAPTYQWQKGSVAITGATSATYSIASAATGDAGNYTAVATNSAGTATSAVATLTVSAATTAPAITTQPASQTVAPGGAASFTVAASGNPAPSYQWYFGGAVISGASSATLSLSNVQVADAGNYYVSVSNSAGTVISTTATLTVQTQAPVTLLANQQVVVGHDVAITAAGVSGTLQWQASTDSGATWQNLTDNSNYSGSTSDTLEILHVTSALNGNRYRAMVSGTASSATTLSVVAGYFTLPTGVGSNSSGNLFVSDGSAQTIQKISVANQVTLVAGSAGQSGLTDGNGTTARFNQPGALVAAPDGSLGISDTGNDIIRNVTVSGGVSTLAGLAGNQGSLNGTGTAARLSFPIGIARDSTGVLFVADSQNNTIRKIAAGGAVTTFAGSAGAAGASDGLGSNARFNHPAGLTIDSIGNVYVADAANHTIRMITPVGVVTTLAGLAGVSGSQDGTGSGARFNNPGGLTVSTTGELFLADTGNSLIRKITVAGNVTTLAGLPGISGLMDGTGGYAWFDHPEGLTWNADGNLYVADTSNAVIRKVTPAGVVTTPVLSTGTSSSTSLPDSTPTPPAASTGTSAASSSSGGGGAMSEWFTGVVGLALLARMYGKKSRQICQ